MDDVISGIFDAVVEYLVDIITQLLDFTTNLLIGMFNLNLTDSSSGILVTIDEFFPMFAAARWVMVFIGMTIAFLLFIMNIYRSLLHTMASEEVEHPLVLVVRFIFTIIMIVASFTICRYVIFMASYWYAAMWSLSSYESDNSTSYAALTDTLKENLAIGAVSMGTFIIPIITLIILISIFLNLIKLYLEVVERYILVAVLSYTSPIAMAALGSRTTSRVFSGWMRVYFSQFLLMTLNIWFIRTFNGAVARALVTTVSVGEITIATDPGQRHVFINGTSLAHRTGADGTVFLVFLVMLLALLIVAQRADAYLASTGLNVAQTGSSLLGEMMMAGKVAEGQMRSMGNVNKNLSRGADLARGSLLPVQSGKTAAAFAASGIGMGTSADGMLNTVGGERVVTQAAANKETGAVIGKIEDPTRASTATTVASTPADLADPNAPGHLSRSANGEMMKTMAQGPLAWEALSAIQSKPNANLPDMKDGTFAGIYNQSYNDALAKGDPNPSETAKKATEDFARDQGALSDLNAHQAETEKIFPEGKAVLGDQALNGVEISPSTEPGVYDVNGTTDDGQLVSGKLVDQGVLGERSAEDYPDASFLSDEDGNQYAFLPETDNIVSDSNGFGDLESADNFYSRAGSELDADGDFDDTEKQTAAYSAQSFGASFNGDVVNDNDGIESLPAYGNVNAAMFHGDGIYSAMTDNQVFMTMEDANKYHRREGDATFRGTTKATINGQERTFNVYANKANPKDPKKIRPGKRKTFTRSIKRQTTPTSAPMTRYKKGSLGSFLNTRRNKRG